jgi:hypothetical protein
MVVDLFYFLSHFFVRFLSSVMVQTGEDPKLRFGWQMNKSSSVRVLLLLGWCLFCLPLLGSEPALNDAFFKAYLSQIKHNDESQLSQSYTVFHDAWLQNRIGANERSAVDEFMQQIREIAQNCDWNKVIRDSQNGNGKKHIGIIHAAAILGIGVKIGNSEALKWARFTQFISLDNAENQASFAESWKRILADLDMELQMKAAQNILAGNIESLKTYCLEIFQNKKYLSDGTARPFLTGLSNNREILKKLREDQTFAAKIRGAIETDFPTVIDGKSRDQWTPQEPLIDIYVQLSSRAQFFAWKKQIEALPNTSARAKKVLEQTALLWEEDQKTFQ